MRQLIWLIPLVPLAGFLINGLVYLLSHRTKGVPGHGHGHDEEDGHGEAHAVPPVAGSHPPTGHGHGEAHAVIPFNAGYAASKCALEGWIDALRREVRPLGVRVSLIQAAEIQTEFLAKAKPEGIPTDTPYKAQYALGQMFFAKPRPSTPPRAAAPRRVSELVAKILQRGHPRPRYHVGRGAKPLYVLGLLPDRVQDQAFGKLVGIASRSGQPDS